MERFVSQPVESLASLLAQLPDDAACRTYIEHIRWGGRPSCRHCGHNEAYCMKVNGEFKGLYKCRNCKERYTATAGTHLEGSHIGLRKWTIAMYMVLSRNCGVSSHQLARDLGITQKSAWYMLKRIKAAVGGDMVLMAAAPPHLA